MRGSTGGGGGGPDAAVLLRIVETLQGEKGGLNKRVSSLEEENARLRRANLEKDRQIAMLLAGAGGA